jgi:hypothetical protein
MRIELEGGAGVERLPRISTSGEGARRGVVVALAVLRGKAVDWVTTPVVELFGFVFEGCSGSTIGGRCVIFGWLQAAQRGFVAASKNSSQPHPLTQHGKTALEDICGT